jgi:hypothetical protein
MKRLDSTANRAWASFKAVNAEEFKSVEDLSARLRGLQKIQSDHNTTIEAAAPHVAIDEQGKWSIDAKGSRGRLFLRERAFEQLFGLMDFRSSEALKLPGQIASDALAYFTLLNGQKKIKIRQEGDAARAIVGPDYVPVSHAEIVDIVKQDFEGRDVNFAALTDKRMFVMLEGDKRMKGPDGSELVHGLYVGNSETGEGSYFASDFFCDCI